MKVGSNEKCNEMLTLIRFFHTQSRGAWPRWPICLKLATVYSHYSERPATIVEATKLFKDQPKCRFADFIGATFIA